MREEREPRRRRASLRELADAWSDEHETDVLTALVAVALVVALAAGMATY